MPLAAQKRDSVPTVLDTTLSADSLQFQQPSETIQLLKHHSLWYLLGEQYEITAYGHNDHFLHNNLVVM